MKADPTHAHSIPRKTTAIRADEPSLPLSLGHTMLALRVSPPNGAYTVYDTGAAVMRQEDLAKILQGTPGRSGKGKRAKGETDRRLPPKAAAFTGRMVGDMEMPKHVDLWKITRYANWSGLPVSTIMLVQELAAHLRDGNVDLARTIADATRSLCAKVVTDANRLAARSGDGPGQELAPEDKAAFLERCRSGRRKPLTERDQRLLLIIDELFRTYPAAALKAKRRAARNKKA